MTRHDDAYEARARTGRGAPGYCIRCDELGNYCSVSGAVVCRHHWYLGRFGFDMDAIDAAADRAGISVACLVREAIARTVEALKRP